MRQPKFMGTCLWTALTHGPQMTFGGEGGGIISHSVSILGVGVGYKTPFLTINIGDMCPLPSPPPCFAVPGPGPLCLDLKEQMTRFVLGSCKFELYTVLKNNVFIFFPLKSFNHKLLPFKCSGCKDIHEGLQGVICQVPCRDWPISNMGKDQATPRGIGK